MSAVRPRPETVAGLLAAAAVFGFVLTSALVAVLPQFRFESQFPALMPLAVFLGAAGVDGVAELACGVARPWRAAFGVLGAVPYLALLFVVAAAPGLAVPWWVAALVAAFAAAPFLVLAVRGDAWLPARPAATPDGASRRGTALAGAALALLALAASGPLITAATVGVLTTGALLVAALRTGGLARAAGTWSAPQWAAAVGGALVVWGCVLVHGTTPWLIAWWADLLAMVLAGGPLIAASGVRVGWPRWLRPSGS